SRRALTNFYQPTVRNCASLATGRETIRSRALRRTLGMGAPLDDIGLAEDVMPLGQLLLRSARRSPDKEALVFPDARITYRELADTAWGVARSLLALGVKPGEHVGVFMTNHP